MENQPAKSGTFLTRSDLKLVALSIIEKATAANTRLAYPKDLANFWTWAAAALGAESSYPVPVEVLFKFIVDHTGTTMDGTVDQALVDAEVKQRTGAHSVSTITRRISSISMAHKLQGINDDANLCRSESVRMLLSKVRRSRADGGRRRKKRPRWMCF